MGAGRGPAGEPARGSRAGGGGPAPGVRSPRGPEPRSPTRPITADGKSRDSGGRRHRRRHHRVHPGPGRCRADPRSWGTWCRRRVTRLRGSAAGAGRARRTSRSSRLPPAAAGQRAGSGHAGILGRPRGHAACGVAPAAPSSGGGKQGPGIRAPRPASRPCIPRRRREPGPGAPPGCRQACSTTRRYRVMTGPSSGVAGV